MLNRARQELQKIGFEVLVEDQSQLVCIRQKWYWDCIATKLTTVVYVHEVETLSAAVINADRENLIENAKALDPSKLPRGLQKGTAVISLYLAKKVEPDAIKLLMNKPQRKFAFFYVPAAFDLSTQQAFYLTSTPAWGALYYNKFRYVIRRALTPTQAPTREPLSKMGIVLGALALFAFSLTILRFLKILKF